MQEKAYEVKSGGNVIGSTVVQIFDSIADSVEFFKKAFEGDLGKAEKEVLGLINSQHKANVTNAERVRLTRGVSPMKALRERMKSDPGAKALVESLLAQLGIDATKL